MALSKPVTPVLAFVIDRLREANSRVGCRPDGEN